MKICHFWRCNVEVGDYAFVENGKIVFSEKEDACEHCIGIVGFVNSGHLVRKGKRGLIVALDYQYLTWSHKSVIMGLSIKKGNKNTTNLVSCIYTGIDFPASFYCSKYVIHGVSNWFLPDIKQLLRLGKEKTRINIALQKLHKDVMLGYYWSSTCGDKNTAQCYCIDWKQHEVEQEDQKMTFKTRPVRSF